MPFSVALVFFIICLTLVAYVYFGYPLLVWLWSRGATSKTNGSATELPSVCLIIAAHNEEAIIRQKLENTMALRYPRDRLEIMVASDGSEDQTDAIVNEFSSQGVRLHRLSPRQGKFPAISSAVKETSGEILVFSDANAIYEPDALEQLVKPFQDDQVGCVCGKLLYVNATDTSISEGESLYWRYENRLKEWESNFNSLIGANGSIYALRRTAFVPIDLDLSDDYGLPLAAYARGYRTVYQPTAISREEAPLSIYTEFKKKNRFVSHQLTTLSRLWSTLRPFHDPKLLLQLVSHKILRTGVPFLLLSLLLLAGMMYEEPFGRFLLWCQVAFYGLALCGLVAYKFRISLKIFAIPLYFCTVNAAAIIGVFQFLGGKNYAAWNEK